MTRFRKTRYNRSGSIHPHTRAMHQREPGLLDTVKSVLAAFIGVQSNAKRERDFKYGKPSHFIAVGLVLTALFVLVVLGVVRGVMLLAGAG